MKDSKGESNAKILQKKEQKIMKIVQERLRNYLKEQLMDANKLQSLIKPFTLVLGLMFLSSCLLKSKHLFDLNEIELLAQKDSVVPSLYYHFDFFCRGNNNKIVKLQFKELEEVYHNQFYNLDYNDYLFKLLNQQITIDTSNRTFFELNDIVYKTYNSNSLDTFLNIYCKRFEKRYQFKKELSQSELNTLSYLLFINGYFVTFDDYIGVYNITHKKNIFPAPPDL